jgi:hypothetical protein
MTGLPLALMPTWTVWLAKTIELARVRRTVRKALRILFSVHTLPQAARATSGRGDVVGRLRVRSRSHRRCADGVKERLAWQRDRIEAAAGRGVARGKSILATVEAVAPFVGLFGTASGMTGCFEEPGFGRGEVYPQWYAVRPQDEPSLIQTSSRNSRASQLRIGPSGADRGRGRCNMRVVEPRNPRTLGVQRQDEKKRGTTGGNVADAGRVEGTIGNFIGTQWQTFIPQQSTAAYSYKYEVAGTDC